MTRKEEEKTFEEKLGERIEILGPFITEKNILGLIRSSCIVQAKYLPETSVLNWLDNQIASFIPPQEKDTPPAK